MCCAERLQRLSEDPLLRTWTRSSSPDRSRAKRYSRWACKGPWTYTASLAPNNYRPPADWCKKAYELNAQVRDATARRRGETAGLSGPIVTAPRRYRLWLELAAAVWPCRQPGVSFAGGGEENSIITDLSRGPRWISAARSNARNSRSRRRCGARCTNSRGGRQRGA